MCDLWLEIDPWKHLGIFVILPIMFRTIIFRGDDMYGFVLFALKHWYICTFFLQRKMCSHIVVDCTYICDTCFKYHKLIWLWGIPSSFLSWDHSFPNTLCNISFQIDWQLLYLCGRKGCEHNVVTHYFVVKHKWLCRIECKHAMITLV